VLRKQGDGDSGQRPPGLLQIEPADRVAGRPVGPRELRPIPTHGTEHQLKTHPPAMRAGQQIIGACGHRGSLPCLCLSEPAVSEVLHGSVSATRSSVPQAEPATAMSAHGVPQRISEWYAVATRPASRRAAVRLAWWPSYRSMGRGTRVAPASAIDAAARKAVREVVRSVSAPISGEPTAWPAAINRNAAPTPMAGDAG
jgi:hypothetical protein